MQTTGISTGSSAMQALNALVATLKTSAPNPGFSAVSTGQSLPGGNDSGVTAPAAPTAPPPPSNLASQFGSGILSILTSLQDVAAGAASAAATAAMGSSPLGLAVGIGVSDLTAALGHLGKSLNTPAPSASVAPAALAATSSTAAASLAAATSSTGVMALDKLISTLEALAGDPTGAHHLPAGASTASIAASALTSLA